MQPKLDSLSDVYWNIFKISEKLLHHCERNKITIWPEFGSLLGHVRHRGIIPWDYDGDFGMFIGDKDRFIESFQLDNPDIILSIDYYKDEGCFALHLPGNENDIVDIIWYEDKGGIIDSLQSEATKLEYPSNNGYCYDTKEFYPLWDGIFLGHRVSIPYDSEAILTKIYGNWQEIPLEFRDYICDDYIGSSVKDIGICSDSEYEDMPFEDLVGVIGVSKEPFILRATPHLDCENFERILLDQTSSILGYESSVEWEEQNLSPKDVWESYSNSSLKINIVDSPLENKGMLPPEWESYARSKLGTHYDFALTWVFTCAPKVTHFHIDPPYAGGFMKILKGKKVWWCVKPVDYYHMVKMGQSVESMAKMDLHEIMRLEDSYLFGKIQIGVLNAGDLIWFPIDTMHKVITLEDSHGFGGYL